MRTNRNKKPKLKVNLSPKNEEIRLPFVTLITDEGERIENISTKEALQMAYDRGLDLVLLSDGPSGAITKIMDWGKYRYQKTKKEQENRKQQKKTDTKEIRIRPKTGPHDIEIKTKKIKEFLEKGHKVKITMVFRGREVVYLDKGKETLNQMVADLGELAKPEDSLGYQFKRLSITLAPIK